MNTQLNTRNDNRILSRDNHERNMNMNAIKAFRPILAIITILLIGGLAPAASVGAQDVPPVEPAVETVTEDTAAPILESEADPAIATEASVEADDSVVEDPSLDGQEGVDTFSGSSGGSNGLELAARHSRKCLDLTDRSTSDGMQLQQYGCHGEANQRWSLNYQFTVGGRQYFQIKSRSSGKCMEVQARTGSGSIIRQRSCNGSATQHWAPEYVTVTDYGPIFQLRNQYTLLCAAVSGGSTANKVVIVQSTCSNYTYAQWYIH